MTRSLKRNHEEQWNIHSHNKIRINQELVSRSRFKKNENQNKSKQKKDIWDRLDRFILKSRKTIKKKKKIEKKKYKSRTTSSTKARSESSIKRIETKHFSDTKKYDFSKKVKSLTQLFSLKIKTSNFIFESKKFEHKRIETKTDSSNQETSVTQKITLIKSILSISASKRNKMSDSNTKFFWDKRNERENSNEYLKDIEFIYRIDYKSQKTIEKNKIKYKDNVHRILFRQNLKKEVENWYSDLNKTMKSDWTTLQLTFKT